MKSASSGSACPAIEGTRRSRDVRGLEPHRPLDMLHTLLAKTFVVVSFISFHTFCFAMGNTSWTTKHKIVLSILCGLNKIKIIKTISFSLCFERVCVYVYVYVCVCVCVCKGISMVHPLNVVYFLRLFLSWYSIWVSFCVNDFISFFCGLL